MHDYFPNVDVKIRGRRGQCKSVFTNEQTPSMMIYIDQNRFHDFSTTKSGDSLDLIAHATGKPLKDILRSFTDTFDIDIILERKRQAEKEKQFKQCVNLCWLRIMDIWKRTIDAERQVKNNPSDKNVSLMADVFYLRQILKPLLNSLESKDKIMQDQALQQAIERGLFIPYDISTQ